MKLIIDIPVNDYRHIKEYYEKNDIVEATYSYIYHGIPLDDVLNKMRSEIKSISPKTYPFLNSTDRYVKEDDVLQIIDKYREEQGE